MNKNIANRGFTLLEILISLTILAVGILGIAGLAGTAIKSSGYSQAVTQATNISQKMIESLQSVDFDNLQASDNLTSRTELRRTCVQTDMSLSRPVYTCTPTLTVSNEGKIYTWTYTVTYIDLDNNGTANPNADGLKRIDVTVSWSDPLWHTTKSLSVATLRTNGA